MISLNAIFWILLGVVLYTYIGYAMVMWLVIQFKKSISNSHLIDFYPPVVHIIAAYNEEDCIEEKLINALAIDYPAHLYTVIVVADGSTDQTVAIVQKYPTVKLMFQLSRNGKMDALNRAVSTVPEDAILVFSDANTSINASSIQTIVRHYQNPRVGGVAGEKRVYASAMGAGMAEGLYWKYESALKQLESDFHTVIGAAGELFSIRRNLYFFDDKPLILDDFSISLNVCKMGFIVQYEAQAIAIEAPSISLAEEQKRKIRISAGAFKAIFNYIDLLNIFKYGRLSFQYISHRFFRWTVCPLALPLLLILNVWIVAHLHNSIYDVLLICQCTFYGLAILGSFCTEYKTKVLGWLFIPFYFVFMHWSVWKGFFRFLQGGQNPQWEKSKREIINQS